MRSFFGVAMAVGAIVLLAACGSSSNNNKKAATPTGASQPVATRAATVAATAALGNPALATPATNPVQRVNGTVQSVDNGRVTLKEGGGFAVNDQTRVTRRTASSASALQPGQIVAITAKRQPDNTLLASLVVVFPTAPTGFQLGQSPLDQGNLMTNATVDKVSGNSFSVTFPGGSAQVTVAPDGQVATLTIGTAADIKPGAVVSAAVRDGVAQTVAIQ
jgi:hypothetical protein